MKVGGRELVQFASPQQLRTASVSVRGDNLMPSFAAAFFDAKIAAVSKYVIGHFGEMQGSVTSADVRAARN